MVVSSRAVEVCGGANARGVAEGKIRRLKAVRIIFARNLVSPVLVDVGRE